MKFAAEPILIGYFPKQIVARPDWLKNQGVLEICSVSECISKGPANWIQAWKHNDWGFYDTEELASQVAREELDAFQVFAYELFPFRWLKDQEEKFSIAARLAPLPDAYQYLGYDIVTRSIGSFFECSPLSCNSAAEKYAVNKFCLIEDLDDAYRGLMEISRDGHYEPGPYYLTKVFRKTK
jgi:hypothetical protein